MYKFNDETIDNRIQELIYSGDATRYTCKFAIEGVDVSPSQISNITKSSPIIDTSEDYFYLGTFISDKLTVKFQNLDGLNIKSGNRVSLDIDMDISSNNKIDFDNINYSSGNDATVTRSGGEYSVVNTDSQYGCAIFNNTDLQLKPSTTYTFSAKIESTTNEEGSCVYANSLISSDGAEIFGEIVEEGERSFLTFTTPSEIPNGAVLALYPMGENETTVFSEVMVNEGYTMLDYEPYAGSSVTIPIGAYTIDELAENYQETCEIVCLDDATKFKPAIDYSPCFTDYQDTKAATIGTILEYICNEFNVPLDPNYPTTNDDVVIGTFDPSVSGKQWISYIAEIKGCNAKIGRDGMLHFIPLNGSVLASIDAVNGKSWDLGEKYEISQVTYFDAIRNFTFPDPDGDDSENILFIRQANPFVVGDTVVGNIYNQVGGAIIWNLSEENYGNITLDAGDVIQYELGNSTYPTIYNGNFNYQITIMGKNEVKIPTKEQNITTNVLHSDVYNLKKIYTAVDQINGQVEINADNIKTYHDDLTNHYYTIEQANQMIVNAEKGITNTFSEAGGNNILRNTRFFAQEVLETGQVYEYWYGNVTKSNNDNAANGVSILLRNADLYQEQDVANGNYTLSFMYKKLIHLATCKVIINENEYELTSEDDYTLFQTGINKYYQTSDTTYQSDVSYYILEDGNYILLVAGTDYEVGDTITGIVYNVNVIDPIEINSNYIKVEFVSDTNNACEIYDIMLNAGQVKLAYSQNQNETVTSTVNISKGITITASDKNVKLLATPDGIRIKNTKTNNNVTYFTEDGMETDNAIIKDTSEIVGIYRQKIDDQIWDSMI